MLYCIINCTVCGKPRTKETHVKDTGRCRPCNLKHNALKMKSKRHADPEKYKAIESAWRKANPERVQRYNTNWSRKTNPDRFKELNHKIQERYRQKNIDKVRIWKIKYQNKRYRSMETNPLNKWFKGCQGHHIDKKNIIYIPTELHKSIWHNHNKPETMIQINILAWTYMESQVL